MKIALPIVLCAALLFGFGASATPCTPISEAPFTIETPGCYLLTNDIDYKDGDAIIIKSDDVSLDLGGHILRGSGDVKGTRNGIYANDVQRLTVKNGAIEGFFYGIRVDPGEHAQSVAVEKIEARKNTFRGIVIQAENARVIGNRVSKTGGTQVYRDSFAAAIEVMGHGCHVEDNRIDGVFPVGIGEGLGISLSHKRDGCIVRNNRITSPPDSNATFGIWVVLPGKETLVEKNHIEGFVIPFNYKLLRDEILPVPPVRFAHNTGAKLGCGVDNYPAYFTGMPTNNKLLSAGKPCPMLIAETFRRYRKQPDKNTAFMVANAKHWCEATPALSDEACCQQKLESLLFFEKSAELGLEEAARVLPAMRKRAVVSPACKRSDV
jgi:hypothetical protein